MQSKKKSRAVLITSIGISLFAALSMGVSTFAWYQASINAIIGHDPSTTAVSVSSPEVYDISSPEVYVYSRNGSNGYITDTTSPASGSIYDDTNLINFEKIDLSVPEEAALLNVGNLLPGRRMTFGLKITTEDHVSLIKSATLSLVDYTTRNNNYRKVLSAVTEGSTGTQATYPNGQDKIIRIEDIVKMYGAVNTTGSFVEPTSGDVSLGNYDKTYTAGTGFREKQYDCDVEIAKGNSLNSISVCLFFTLEFSNVGTTWYKEYTKTGNNYNSCYEIISSTYTGNRFFHQDGSNGSSTCYEGLRFTIGELSIVAE